MKVTITLTCPRCNSSKVVKNGKKACKKQNYVCKACQRQFIVDHNLSYSGCLSWLSQLILRMLVRGCGIRDIAFIAQVSTQKVLSVLVNSRRLMTPKKKHYESLEVDEFWTYVGKKSKKYWLIYAYDRAGGEVVAWVWGRRNLATVKALRKKLKHLPISYSQVCFDHWKAFKRAFRRDTYLVGKQHTQGIEGNNCCLRHRIRRAFRKTCCFSKKLANHIKTFHLAFFYINYGYI